MMKFIFFTFLVTFLIVSCVKQESDSITNNKKQALIGLVSMGSVHDLYNGNFNVLKEATVHPDIYSGVVIRATWGELEPQKGTFDFSAVYRALDAIKAYNHLHPNHQLGAKLRVSSSINPPAWVLNLANGPVEIIINQFQSYPIGLFWTHEYRQAWHNLQLELATEFDTNTLIQEVCISSPAMATDEPLVTIFNPATIQNLQRKGFTDAAFQKALNGTIDDYACWKNTLIDFSFNTYREIDTGVPISNSSFTTNLIKSFKNKYKERAILSNHGLQENLTQGALDIYNTFAILGGNIATQTKSPNDLNEQSIRVGLNYGVSEFEIWDSREAGGYADYNLTDLQNWKNIISN